MPMRRLGLSIALLALVSIFIYPPAQGGMSERVSIKAAIVRLGSDLYVHDDGGHAPLGIARLLVTDACDLRVVLRGAPEDRISTWVADEDAQLARFDILAGISGGASSATVVLWHDGEHVCVTDPMFDAANADVGLLFITWGDAP
jgi:hypothetical protein